MAKNLNSQGKVILSDLTEDEKVDLLLDFWNFIEDVNTAFLKEFEGDYYDDEEDEDFKASLEKLGHSYIWTIQGDNSGVVSFSGMDFEVWGTAFIPEFIPLEADWDSVVKGWLVGKQSRSKAQGLHRSLYSKADPTNDSLPVSDFEKEFDWNNEPYAWQRAYFKCPFCEPLDDQTPVDCPINDPRLAHLAEEHEYSQSWSTGEAF